MSAKRSEMTLAGLANPSDSAVKHAISKEELSKHCKRKTRGAEKTIELIEALFPRLRTRWEFPYSRRKYFLSGVRSRSM
jgi:hypothetical protein